MAAAAAFASLVSLQNNLRLICNHPNHSLRRTINQELYKSLYGRRYLVILDDMWSVEPWDEMKFLFPDINNGSRIVVTSRDSYVANHVAVNATGLEMKCLDEEKSWDLFCQKAFIEQYCPPELEEIGRKIVEKCRGLPLAIVVVGGHFRNSSMTPEYWENVAYDMNSILNSTNKEEQCMNVLSLSYSYLHVHLKPCLLFMGAFTEDESIDVRDVYNLWIAEGIVESFENTLLEVVAKGYIHDLFMRDLFLVDLVGPNRHDLVRQMCRKIARDEELFDVIDTPQAVNRARRVVINGKVPEIDHQAEKSAVAPARCLIYKGGRLPYDFKLLRTLDKVYIESFSDSILEHVNLRYLKADHGYTTRPILYLPSTISLLWNLQILNIRVPYESTVIAPYEIWEMLQLRHLVIEPIRLVNPLPLEDRSKDSVLRNLHTLSLVQNCTLSEEICKRIPHIRELYLSYCGDAIQHYSPHNLVNFHELENLSFTFDPDSKWRDFALSLTFPTSLKRLHLSGCGVDWEELTMMVGSLAHLVSLLLDRQSVIGSVWNPVEGNFLRLEGLHVYDCDDLIQWNADSFHFPVLCSLTLHSLSKLDELPFGIGDVPTL